MELISPVPAVRNEVGVNGLPILAVRSSLAEARIYLHGAHVTHFQPMGGSPLLFMSGSSYFEASKPIRGGVPLIFPWFGPRADDGSSPAHGFARLKTWQVESVEEESDGAVTIALTLVDDESTRASWPYAFHLRYIVRVAATLGLSLEVTNRSDKAFNFEEAFHTYLAVGDARKISIRGLEAVPYLDKMHGMQSTPNANGPILIKEETDRCYLGTTSTCVIEDPLTEQRISIQKEGSASTVVWNPWVAKSKAMADFGDEEWPEMVCVETCNIMGDQIRLEPGQKHVMHATIVSDKLPPAT